MFSYEIKQNLFEITSILSNVESLNKLELFDFENYYFTRLNESYKTLFYQAKIIYFEYFPLNSDEDETTPYWAIYFDMDFLFEKFVGHLLYKSGFDVKEQEKLQIYKSNYVTPDFVLYNERIVIDSKYTEYKQFGKSKSPNSQSIFQITNYMDNLNFEGSLVMIGNANENILFNNLMHGKSFNVISLDMGSDFDNLIDNFRFFNDNNKLNFEFSELESLPDEEEDNNSDKNSNNYKKAKQYLRNKEYLKAIDILDTLIPTKKILNDIGFAYFQLKEYDNAIKFFKKSISLEENCYAYDYLGRSCHFGKKDYDKAIAYYTNAINLIKNNKCKNNNPKRISYFYNNRGYSYRNNSEYFNAIKDFKKAITLNEDLSNKLLLEISRLEEYA